MLTNLFDGGWVDTLTILTAILYSVYIHHKVGKPAGQKFVSRDTGLAVAHGVALFPLFLLAVSSLSSAALEQLLHSHKIILSVAGLVALLAILEERPVYPKTG